MIKLNFELVLTLYLSGVLCVVVWGWVRYNYSTRRSSVDDMSKMHQCPYCAYIFYDFSENPIFTCPRCHSYVQGEKNDMSVPE